MANRHLVIDNRRPDAADYPTSEPAHMLDSVVYVNEGDYIVDRHGDILIVTSGNMKWQEDSPLAGINRGYIRVKYIGNQDDALECTNQIRFATESEIKAAKNWTNTKAKYTVERNGQLSFI